MLVALRRRAFEHKHTLTIGRSHGIHAEPTSFGLKLAGHYAEFSRNRARLVAARAEVATCAISGAVGTFAHLDPAVEEFVAARLGLVPAPVSPQVIPRARPAAPPPRPAPTGRRMPARAPPRHPQPIAAPERPGYRAATTSALSGASRAAISKKRLASSISPSRKRARPIWSMSSTSSW